jgi:hypothetical protein
VFTVQPTVYFEGQDPSVESASVLEDSNKVEPLNPATVTVGIVALGIVAVAGSATAIYYEVRGGAFAGGGGREGVNVGWNKHHVHCGCGWVGKCYLV